MERGRSRSRGEPGGGQRGVADNKVGWAGGSPKARSPDSPPSNPGNNMNGDNTIVNELKKIIEKQNEQIRELMRKLEKATNNNTAQHTPIHEETLANPVGEGPRKLPRRRSPPAVPAGATQNSEVQAMEDEELPPQQEQKKEEQVQLTPGESVILAALSRLEERVATIEAKHDRLAARLNALEIKQKYGTLKKERAERLKETIAKRRGRLDTNQKDEAETTQQI